jgi:hypothetical protein
LAAIAAKFVAQVKVRVGTLTAALINTKKAISLPPTTSTRRKGLPQN